MEGLRKAPIELGGARSPTPTSSTSCATCSASRRAGRRPPRRWPPRARSRPGSRARPAARQASSRTTTTATRPSSRSPAARPTTRALAGLWPLAARVADHFTPYFGASWAYISQACATWPGRDADRYAGPFNRKTGGAAAAGQQPLRRRLVVRARAARRAHAGLGAAADDRGRRPHAGDDRQPVRRPRDRALPDRRRAAGAPAPSAPTSRTRSRVRNRGIALRSGWSRDGRLVACSPPSTSKASASPAEAAPSSTASTSPSPAARSTGLLGPSGCGKTTLMRSIVGVQRIRRGTVEVLGEPAGSASLRPRVGYVTQAPSVYADLTVDRQPALLRGRPRRAGRARRRGARRRRPRRPPPRRRRAPLRRPARPRVARLRAARRAGADRARRADRRASTRCCGATCGGSSTSSRRAARRCSSPAT